MATPPRCQHVEVKSFNDTRGFGFLKIPGANMDLYFHGRDMDEASQGLLMLVGASGLANCNAPCRVEARADGRWNGRNVSLLEAGVQMMDGMKLAGMIRYFYDHKGFGFINVTGNPIDIYFQGDVGPDAQTRCEEMGPVGTVVWFTVYAQTDSRTLAIHWLSGSMDYGGGKGSGKGSGKVSLPKAHGWAQVEKQIIPGCELVGRLKSYNAATWRCKVGRRLICIGEVLTSADARLGSIPNVSAREGTFAAPVIDPDQHAP
eukprot:Skav219149  [mRNA]  locus=scaffold1574:802598:812458:- [translate_table: standard]